MTRHAPVRVAALLAAAAWLAPAPATPAAGPELEGGRIVRHVRLEGHEAYPDRTLKALMRTRGRSTLRFWRSHPYRTDFIRFDEATLVQFYRRHGYLDARMDSVRVEAVPGSDRSVDVSFHLTEGPRARVEGVAFEGADSASVEALRKGLELHAGSPLDAVQLEADRQAIEDHYANLGYVAVSVRDTLEVDSTSVAIRYQIEPGPRVALGSVKVEGNHRTRPSFVTREIALKRGEWMSRQRLTQAQQRIYDAGYYSDVQFERSAVDSATQRADLFVTVKERKMSWVDVGLGYGTVDQLRLTSEWGNRNLGRQGIRLTVDGKLGVRFTRPEGRPLIVSTGNTRAEAAFSQPWFLKTRTQATLGGYAETNPVRTPGSDIPLTAVGGTFSLRRDFWRFTHGTISLETRHGILDSTALVRGTAYTTKRVTLAGERDSRVNLFDAKKGSDLLGSIEVAGGLLQGSSQFQKYDLQASTYLPALGRATLAFRVHGGYIRPFGFGKGDTLQGLDQIPLDDRYRTGGATSVRGYYENELGTRSVLVPVPGDTTRVEREPVIRGGAVLLLGSVELRFPLVWILSGAGFVDAGGVWDAPRDLTAKRLFSPLAGGAGYQDMRYTAGLGIRFASPVGPVRIDYGWKLRGTRDDQQDALSPRRGSFHFSLGQAF